MNRIVFGIAHAEAACWDPSGRSVLFCDALGGGLLSVDGVIETVVPPPPHRGRRAS